MVLNIVFMGTPEFAIPSLEHFHLNHNVLAVFTQPPKPAGRGMKSKKSPIHIKAKELNLKTYTPTKLDENNVGIILKKFNPDFIVVVAYGIILPKHILKIPKFIAINGHASLLPKWRGAAPIQRCLEAGEKETGTTAMLMEPGLDSGPILLQKKLKILKEDDASSIHKKLSNLTAKCLLSATKKYCLGEIKPIKQNISKATYAKKLEKKEGLIDWKLSSSQIYNKLKGFSPFPGLFTILNDEKLKIINGNPLNLEHSQKPGTIIETESKLIVACGQNTSFFIKTLQRPGKNILYFDEFLRGSKIEKGFSFEQK